MSGTSGDGVDASLIISNGINSYEPIQDKYYEYDENIYKNFHAIKDKINNKTDIKKLASELNELEKNITLFHAKIIKDLSIKDPDCLIGFHGQTIYHNPLEKISVQLGNPKLLFQLIKKKIIFNFRKNDILNGGEGAPLTPLFHQLVVFQKKISLPTCILNIGGISNITLINQHLGEKLVSKDIGPGNCLIDKWIRKNSEKKFDDNGRLASLGKNNEIILEQAQELYSNRTIKNRRSFDVNDFDVSFARGLSLEDGARTLTEFTADILSAALNDNILKFNELITTIHLCGGGRKNKFLVERIQKKIKSLIKLRKIDDFQIDGDFIESQAFAFLAIRSYLKLPISFPGTTGCKKATLGGELIDN